MAMTEEERRSFRHRLHKAWSKYGAVWLGVNGIMLLINGASSGTIGGLLVLNGVIVLFIYLCWLISRR